MWATALAPHARGHQFSLRTEVRIGDELVWEEISTNLRRGGGRPRASRSGERRRAARRRRPELPASATWKLPGDLGRRYGGVSGDFNPIHVHPLTARLFGFPSAIAHGMWTKARCLAALGHRAPRCASRVGSPSASRSSCPPPSASPSRPGDGGSTSACATPGRTRRTWTATGCALQPGGSLVASSSNMLAQAVEHRRGRRPAPAVLNSASAARKRGSKRAWRRSTSSRPRSVSEVSTTRRSRCEREPLHEPGLRRARRASRSPLAGLRSAAHGHLARRQRDRPRAGRTAAPYWASAEPSGVLGLATAQAAHGGHARALNDAAQRLGGRRSRLRVASAGGCPRSCRHRLGQRIGADAGRVAVGRAGRALGPGEQDRRE